MRILIIVFLVTVSVFSTLSGQEFFTSVGSDFPAFEIEDLEGNLINNETLKGKPSLIVFFGTRCPPCLEELRELNRNLPASYYEKFNIYAVGSTDGKDKLITFNSKKNYKFSYLPDPDQELFDKIGDHTIPRTFLLDKKVKIISQTLGFYKTPFQNLLSKMRKL